MAAGLEYRLTYYVIDSNNNQYTPYNEDIYNQIGFDPITATFGGDYVEFKDLYESTNIINFETPYNYNGVNYPVSSIHCNGSDAIGKEFDVTDGCVIEVYYGKDPETGGNDSDGPEQGEGNTGGNAGGDSGGDSGGDDSGELPDSTEFKEFSFIIYRYYNNNPAPVETINCYWLQRYSEPQDAPDGTIESYLKYYYINKLKPEGTLDEQYKYEVSIPKTVKYGVSDYILEKVIGANEIPITNSGFTTNSKSEIIPIYVYYITIPTIKITNNIPDSIFEIYCSSEKKENYYIDDETNSIVATGDYITTLIPWGNATPVYGSTGVKITLNAIDAKPGTKRYEFEKWEIVETGEVLTTTEFEFDYEITSKDDGKTFKVYYNINPDTTGVKMARNIDVKEIVQLYSYDNNMSVEKTVDCYCPTKSEISNGCGGMVNFLPKKSVPGSTPIEYDDEECVQVQHIESNFKFPPVTIYNATGSYVNPFDIFIGWANTTTDTPRFWAKCIFESNIPSKSSIACQIEPLGDYENYFQDHQYRHNSILFFKFDGTKNWENTKRSIQIELESKTTKNYRNVFVLPWGIPNQAQQAQSCFCNNTNQTPVDDYFKFNQTKTNTLHHINLLTDVKHVYITIYPLLNKQYKQYNP